MGDDSIPVYLASACTSGGEFVWQIVLAFILFSLGWLIFAAGRKGTVRFMHLRKLRDHNKSATGVSIFIWAVGLLTLASTLFGWGC